jgi:hypothetical protein
MPKEDSLKEREPWRPSVDEERAARAHSRRLVFSWAAAIAGALVTFVIFNIVCGLWAVWRYPHNNSMAGVIGFLWGLPAGAVGGAITFFLVFRKTEPAN